MDTRTPQEAEASLQATPDRRLSGRSPSSGTDPREAREIIGSREQSPSFSAHHPDIEIVNAVIAGGAGVNANAVLATRMQGGNPPDTFQIHGGAELLDNWVKTGCMPLVGPR